MIASLLVIIPLCLIHASYAASNASIQVYLLGINGRPSDVYPLPECAGDCDDDSDCADGLVCFTRDVGQDVPGCLGGADDDTKTDYCIQGSSTMEKNATASSTTTTSTASLTDVPSPPNNAPTQGLVISENVALSVFVTDTSPLPECAGDCDDDSDCAEGLICFIRDANEDVPGCLGGTDDDTTTDYCIQGTSSTTDSSATTVTPSTHAIASDASAHVVTVSKNVTTSPTLSPAASPDVISQNAPTSSTALGAKPTSKPTSLRATPIPTTTSFSPGPTPSQTNDKGPFQIRLHWDPTACWQGECDVHFQWCMQCEGFRCNQGDVLWMEPCRTDKVPMQLFEWIPVPTTALRTLRTSLKFGQLRSTQSSEDNTDTSTYLCLDRMSGRQYTLQPCDETITRQWFSGFNPDNTFELHDPPSSTAVSRQGDLAPEGSNCLTMPHHPRHFETIIHTACDEAEGYRTSLWEAVYSWKDSDLSDQEFDPQQYYRLGDRRSNPKCQQTTPCGMCQGHCVTDDDCEGSLKCVERGSWNPEEAPPGCFGTGMPGTNNIIMNHHVIACGFFAAHLPES